MELLSLLQLRLLPYWSLAQISELGPCVWSLCSCSQLSFSLCHMGLSPLMRGLLLSLLPGFQAASFQAEKGGNHTSLRASLLSDTTFHHNIPPQHSTTFCWSKQATEPDRGGANFISCSRIGKVTSQRKKLVWKIPCGRLWKYSLSHSASFIHFCVQSIGFNKYLSNKTKKAMEECRFYGKIWGWIPVLLLPCHLKSFD